MATPSSRKPPQPSRPTRNITPTPRTEPFELVDPRWLLKALALVFSVCILLVYATLCFLYVQGQWQIVLHPSRTLATTPASLGLRYSEVHFADAASGQPQLDGWWIPAGDPASNPTGPTALMLHSGDGSMSDALPRALTLHNQHLNVLLFDYRGYGRSAARHPVESTMQADAASALTFLTSMQHIAPSSIVLYGSGVGASLAVQLAAAHPEIPALILDAPDGDFAARARTDPRSRLVFTRWLFTETFPLAAPLHSLATPKLLIAYTPTEPSLAQQAADPKMTVELANPNDLALLSDIHRFLDLYLPATQN